MGKVMVGPSLGSPVQAPFEAQFRVGWGDLDVNGHMRNTAFLDHAADARMLFFAGHGFTVAKFAALKFGPVMARDELTYKKELRLLDEYTVDVVMMGLSPDGVRFRIANTFRNAAREVAAVVTSEGVWFDLEKRKPRAPPEEMEQVQREMPRGDGFAELPARGEKEGSIQG